MSLVETLPESPTTETPTGRPQKLSWLSALQQPARQRWSALLVLAMLCGMMFFYGINLGELYRTESLRAIIAAEFLRTSNWMVPTLYGQPLLTKPPGMYAAIAAVSLPFGQVTEWTARLPSALAATAVVFLFCWYVSRQVGRLGGLIAAAITPCTYLWLDKAAAAEIDMLQVAWVSAALLFFFRAVECHEVRPKVTPSSRHPLTPSFFWWLASLLCVAGGVLTKWTAPVFFYAAVIPFLFWRGRLRLLFSPQHLLGVALTGVLCLTWVGTVIGQVGWQTFYDTVRGEALPRVSHDHYIGEHGLRDTFFHPFKVLLVNLPWSGFALITLLPGFAKLWDERGRRLLQAFHCWTWPNLLLWTLLPDHATRYSFPLFPGITGLAALAWLACITGRLSPRLTRWHVGFSLVGLVAFGLSAVGEAAVGLWLLPTTVWWLVFLVLAMALWCVYEGFRSWREVRLGGLLAMTVLSWIVIKIAWVHLYVPIRDGDLPVRAVDLGLLKIEEEKPRAPRAKAQILDRAVPAGNTLYVFLAKDEGIMFYYGRPVLRLKDWQQLPLGDEPVYCILQHEEWQKYRKRSDTEMVQEVHLEDEQGDPMVVVGVVKRDPPILRASLP